MTKGLKLSISAAALLATSAFAGTTGYLIVAKGALPALGDNNATVNETNASIQFLTQAPVKVAHELMKSATTNLADNDLNVSVKYIPTSDIPSSTLLTLTPTNAKFAAGTGTLYLVKAKDDGSAWQAVASSDGSTVDGPVTFISQSGITIAAGTQLFISTAQTATTAPSLTYANSSCTAQDVTLQMTDAKSNNGVYVIAGAKTAAVALVDGVQQFTFNVASATGATSNVDVESPSLRSKYVTAGDTTDTNTTQSIFATTFTNTVAGLDKYVTMGGADMAKFNFTASTAISNVEMNAWDTLSLTGAEDLNMTVSETGPVQSKLATKYWPTAGGTNTRYFALSSINTALTLPYNYYVTTNIALDFNNTTYNDVCEDHGKSHTIGINGAILKTSQLTNVFNGYVNITNEDDAAAEVYVDLMTTGTVSGTTNGVGGTQTAGTVKTNLSLGQIGRNTTRMFDTKKIIEASTLNPSNASVNMNATFVVTSPKEKVHGIVVQKRSTQDVLIPLKDNSGFAQ